MEYLRRIPYYNLYLSGSRTEKSGLKSDSQDHRLSRWLALAL